MTIPLTYFDPTLAQWPDLMRGRVPLAPVRNGVDRTTGKPIHGWDHVVQSMFVIFATRFHERVLRPWAGSFVPHILGESEVPRIFTRFFWAIASAIDLWEPNYRIKRVLIKQRTDGTSLTSAEELRAGKATFQNQGVYRPRAHLGDETPEGQRKIGFVGRGHDIWDRAA